MESYRLQLSGHAVWCVIHISMTSLTQEDMKTGDQSGRSYVKDIYRIPDNWPGDNWTEVSAQDNWHRVSSTSLYIYTAGTADGWRLICPLYNHAEAYQFVTDILVVVNSWNEALGLFRFTNKIFLFNQWNKLLRNKHNAELQRADPHTKDTGQLSTTGCIFPHNSQNELLLLPSFQFGKKH